MDDRLGSHWIEQCKLQPQDTVVVGFSGGPDSLCLLHMLWRQGYQLIAVHLDHGWRANSWEDADHARRLTAALHIPFVLGRADVPAFAEQESLSLEEAARIQRYQFLFRQAERYGAQAVAVGHTADDQVETVLMHLVRGTGLSGLTGMPYRSVPNPWSRDIALVRPLLSAWREEILAYLDHYTLHAVEDPTNQDTGYYRNRVRHQLIPALEKYNPRIRERLWDMAEVLRADEAVLAAEVQEIWQAVLRRQGPGYVALDAPSLRAQPLGIRRRLVRQSILVLRPGLRDIDFEAANRALEFLTESTTSGQIDLIAGLYLFIEEDTLWLAAWEAELPVPVHEWPQVDPQRDLELNVPGKLALPGIWTLQASFITMSEEERRTALETRTPSMPGWIRTGWISLCRFAPGGLETALLRSE